MSELEVRMRIRKDGRYLDFQELSREEQRRLVEGQMDLAMGRIGYVRIREEKGEAEDIVSGSPVVRMER
ncbi:MAG: hypothetical protein Q4D55_10595 [Eubacteriales bacterium]|nr:hypothetical protein [Eubacteriales bacterium]